MPTCPLSFENVFGSFSFLSAVSLISSRQPVWRGLKAFTELSLGLINTHFLLEILAQTHRRLWVIRWWHSVQPWLKHGHCSIQFLVVQSMHIIATACYQFIRESKDDRDLLQSYTLSLFPYSRPLSLCFHLLHTLPCIYRLYSMSLPHRDSETEQKLWKTMETVRQCFAGWDRCNRMPESCTHLSSSSSFSLL